jgi:hypothetical protein
LSILVRFVTPEYICIICSVPIQIYLIYDHAKELTVLLASIWGLEK